MKHQKGFSLIEVLVSLMLVMSLGLGLLQQLGQTKQLLTQLVVREKASRFLDQIDESLFVGIEKLPRVPNPYQLTVNKNKQSISVRLSWFKTFGSILRKHTFIDVI
jgi:prepilin-type N-terminal cleavage/methylation domain-containing protein